MALIAVVLFFLVQDYEIKFKLCNVPVSYKVNKEYTSFYREESYNFKFKLMVSVSHVPIK